MVVDKEEKTVYQVFRYLDWSTNFWILFLLGFLYSLWLFWLEDRINLINKVVFLKNIPSILVLLILFVVIQLLNYLVLWLICFKCKRNHLQMNITRYSLLYLYIGIEVMLCLTIWYFFQDPKDEKDLWIVFIGLVIIAVLHELVPVFYERYTILFPSMSNFTLELVTQIITIILVALLIANIDTFPDFYKHNIVIIALNLICGAILSDWISDLRKEIFPLQGV